MGGRLRYADAIALFGSLIGDPSSSVGREYWGFKYSTSIADAFLVQSLSNGKFPSPVPTDDERLQQASFKATGDEASKAAERMSPLFASMY